MGLLDLFTGGDSSSAIDALKRSESVFKNLNTPTARELSLPQLQKYVEAGMMTPAEAQTYLQQSNAYNDENVGQTGTAAQTEALNRLRQVSNAGERGTPMEQAQMENAISQMNTATGGQRGAIEQAMAARGTPYALIQGALENQTVGQQGQQAHLDAVNSAAGTYQAALQALSQQGNVGNALQGQQNTQANTVAGAQNAMQQFNAANQTANSQFNAGNRQQANTANMANKQQVSNNNTGLANTRTQYNAQVPQQVFQNNLAKAQGQAGAATNMANMYQEQGKQNAGIWSGGLNLATAFIPGGAAADIATGGFKAGNPTEDAMNQGYQRGYAHGGYVDGICMDDGGMVPGQASVAGDSLQNDNVPIHASPGEAVIPRSSVAEHPDVVSSLLGDQNQGPQIDFHDVATLLKALRGIRMGAI